MVQLRGDDKARYVASMFDRISGRYDLMNTVMTGGMHHLWRWRTTAVAGRAGLRRGAGHCDGNGRLGVGARRPAIGLACDWAGLRAADAGPRTGQDAQARGEAPRVHWVRGDALNLPFANGRFRCVTCGFGLRNFSDLKAALREMTRVTAPGGRVIILDIVPVTGGDGLSRLFKWYFHRAVPWLGSLIGGSREAYSYLPSQWSTTWRRRSLRT